jgi:hypothetical protein
VVSSAAVHDAHVNGIHRVVSRWAQQEPIGVDDSHDQVAVLGALRTLGECFLKVASHRGEGDWPARMLLICEGKLFAG